MRKYIFIVLFALLVPLKAQAATYPTVADVVAGNIHFLNVDMVMSENGYISYNLDFQVPAAADLDKNIYLVIKNERTGKAVRSLLVEQAVLYRNTSYINYRVIVTNLVPVNTFDDISLYFYSGTRLLDAFGFMPGDVLIDHLEDDRIYAFYDYSLALSNYLGVFNFPGDIVADTPDLHKYLRDYSFSFCGLDYYGSSLICGSDLVLRHYFYIQDQAIFDQNKSRISFTGSKGPYVYFDIQVKYKDVMNYVTMVLLSDQSQVFSYSPATYIAKAVQSEDYDLICVLSALYRYSESLNEI